MHGTRFARAWIATGVAAAVVGAYGTVYGAWPLVHAIVIIGRIPIAASSNIATLRLPCEPLMIGYPQIIQEGDTITLTCYGGRQVRCAYLDNTYIC